MVCIGEMFWGGLVENRLIMSLVQGTNEQGELCTRVEQCDSVKG